MGLKEAGLRGSLRSVSTGVSAIPDSAIDHFVAPGYSETDGIWYGEQGNLNLTATGGPQLQTGVKNGEDAVYFDGADDYFDSGTFGPETQPNTIFVVVKVDNSASDVMIFDHEKSVSSSRNYLFHQPSNSQMQIFSGEFLNGGTPDADWNIYTVKFDGTSSLLRKNGSQISSGNAGANDLDSFRFGALRDGGNYLDGFIPEILPCRAGLSTAEIEDQEQRLASKYGITLA